MPRAGATLLGMMLDNHSQIFHMGESFYWGKLNPDKIRCSCGRIACEILMRVYQEANKLSEVQAIYNACSMIDKLEEPGKVYHSLSLPDDNQQLSPANPRNLARALELSCIGLERLAQIFRQVIGKNIIVDNTKSIYLAEYLAVRKSWKIILLTRDPRGLANSNKNSGLRKGIPRPVDMKIPVYVKFAKKALAMIQMQNVLFVRYEDLCLNPEKKLREICNFIGVSFKDSMLRFKSNKGHTLMGNRMRFDENQVVAEDTGWINGLSQEEKNMICKNKELSNLFKRLGYDLNDKGD